MENNIFDVEQLETRLEMQVITGILEAKCPVENGCLVPSCSWPF